MGVKSEKETTQQKMYISLYDFLRQKSQKGDSVFGMIALNDERNLLCGSCAAAPPQPQRLAGGFVIRSPVVNPLNENPSHSLSGSWW